MVREWLSRFRFFFLGKPRTEVDEEIQFHLERQIEVNLAAGMSPAEARRQAAIGFGGRERAREQCREQRPSWRFESLGRDLRYGMRGLWRNPGFTVVALLTLALAIGANSTVFSLLSQALMRALPVQNPEELVVFSFAGGAPGHTQSEGGNTPGHHHEFSYPMYRDLRDKNTVLSGLIASAPVPIGVVWNDHAEAVSAEMVSGNYFETLGVKPALGRLFVSSDETTEGANPVAVLSFDYWRTHLAEAPVEGKTLLINGTPFTIAGVAAPGFHSMVWGRIPSVYVPITMQRTVQPDWNYLNDRQANWIVLTGRLRPGVSPSQASAAMNSLYLSLRKAEFPLLHDQSQKARHDFIDNAHLNLDAGAKGFSPLRDDVKMPLTIIMGMVLLVVAMAIVNVASLLLVRAATRVREFSMRYALGATSGQILRQLLVEGMLLGVAGAALGLLLAPQALRLLIRFMSGNSTGRTGVLSDARLAGPRLYDCGDTHRKPSLQPGSGNAILESAAGRIVEAASRNGQERFSEVPAHVRCVTDRLQPAADCRRGSVCSHDSESAQCRRRICHRSPAGFRSCSGDGGLRARGDYPG